MSDFIADVAAAETALRDLFPATPLQLNEHLSARYGAEIWLKREDLTPVRSYKLRGAFNAMRKALAAGSTRHFVCASAGNHAQGVAFRLPPFRRERYDLHAGHHPPSRRSTRPASSAATVSRSC